MFRFAQHDDLISFRAAGVESMTSRRPNSHFLPTSKHQAEYYINPTIRRGEYTQQILRIPIPKFNENPKK